MKKYKYNILNLDCANCARKLETELNKNKDLHNVIVNFNTSKISFESDIEISVKKINELTNTIEPGCTITDDKEVKQTKEYHFSILVIAVIIDLIGMYVNMPVILSKILVIISYILLLYRPFINAIKMLVKSKSINENALIVISCVGAYLLGQEMEGMMVVALYVLGKILEEKAINNTRREVKDLLDIKQDYANIKECNSTKKIDVEDIEVGDILVIKKGERIPVDGVVTLGSTLLDTSALTGESELSTANINDDVLSGCINVGDVIEIKATKLFHDSCVSKILSLVEDATDKKAKTETFVSRASRVYTPIVLGLALLVFIFLPLISSVSYSDSLYRALTFLVISCPCAIAISVPLSYFTGIGVCSKNGILIKGSNYLDNLRLMNKIIFDKTGTLTSGSFEVTNIDVIDNNYTKEEVIKILRMGESNSNHPIAKSIMKLSNDTIDTSIISKYKEVSGKGISFVYDNKKVNIGNSKICGCDKVTDIHLSIDGKHIASIDIDDGIKDNAKSSIDSLKSMGITTYMFTGDKKSVADEIGNRLGIDNIKSEMLPDDKYSSFESLSNSNDIVGFVGDGINDAPVLKRADIGISMGSIGSNSAVEASDVVIMNDDLDKIGLGIKISKFTDFIIKENLIFAISVKIIILLLSVIGIATMWFAVFADTGVTLITILNTLRIMRKYK